MLRSGGITGVSRGLERDDGGLEASVSFKETEDDVRAVGYGLWYTSGEDGADMPRAETLRGREECEVMVCPLGRRGRGGELASYAGQLGSVGTERLRGGGARRRRGRWGRSEPPGATLVRIARYCDSCRRPSFGSPRIRPEAPEPLSPPANQNLFLWATSITLYSVRSNLHTPPERHRISTDV